MTRLEAARRVLEDERRPMHAAEIVDVAKERGYIPAEVNADPDMLYKMIRRHITDRRAEAWFEWSEGGVFRLRRR